MLLQQLGEKFVHHLGNQRDRHNQEEWTYIANPCFHGHPRPKRCSYQHCYTHSKTDHENHFPLPDENTEGGQIAGEIEDTSVASPDDKIVTEQENQHKDKKGSGPRSEEAVVETDDEGDGNSPAQGE